MSATLIRGQYILCKVNGHGNVDVIHDGALFQKDGEILEIGRYHSLKLQHIHAEEIGSDKHIVLPGLVNAHHHGQGLPYLLMGTLDDDLEPWLVRIKEHKPVDQYLYNTYCIARLIESGITTVIHSHSPRTLTYEEDVHNILKAYQDGGMRVAFALGVRNQNNLVYHDDQEFLNTLPPSLAKRGAKYLAATKVPEDYYFTLFNKLVREYEENTKIKILHGPLGPQWCSDDLLVRLKESAHNSNTGIHSHMLETIYQKLYAQKKFGKSFVEHLDELGVLSPQVSLGHCIWVTERDIEILAERGVSVCHNPSSNLRLRSGIAPINNMLERDVNVALGMDSMSMNDDEDILEELRLCSYLHRVPGPQKSKLTPGQLFNMITINGAKASLFSDKIGTLEKGKRADIILLDMNKNGVPYTNPDVGIVDILLSQLKGHNVDTVMIDGEVVLHEGKHTRFNRSEITRRLQESLNKPLKHNDRESIQFARDLHPYVVEFYRSYQLPELKPFSTYNSSI